MVVDSNKEFNCMCKQPHWKGGTKMLITQVTTEMNEVSKAKGKGTYTNPLLVSHRSTG